MPPKPKQRPADPIRQAVRDCYGRANVAKVTGASIATVARWIRDGRIHSSEHAAKLAKAVGYPVVWFIEAARPVEKTEATT